MWRPSSLPHPRALLGARQARYYGLTLCAFWKSVPFFTWHRFLGIWYARFMQIK
jgi:hypothetical protein